MAEKAKAKPKAKPNAAGKEKKRKTPGGMSYWQETRGPLYSLVLVLPLLLFYEVGIVLVNGPIRATHGWEVRISSHVLLREVTKGVQAKLGADPEQDGAVSRFCWRIGQNGIIPSAVFVVVALLAWQIATRRAWRLTPWMLGTMLCEAAGLALLYFVVVKAFIDPMIPMTIENDEMPFLQSRYFIDSVLACGAGVYEEFIFRVALIGLFALIVHGLTGTGWKAGTFAGIVLSSVAFSAAHHVGSMGKEFTWLSFAGRTGAGLLFGTVYYYRGFGVAAWTHALFDVLVMIFPGGAGGS